LKMQYIPIAYQKSTRMRPTTWLPREDVDGKYPCNQLHM
jgi:hypothetical protein